MNKYTKVCKICGKTFQTSDGRKILCSSECQAENKRRITAERAKVRYPVNYIDLKIRDVVNILITEKITFEEYMERRDYYVLKHFALKE